MKIGNTLGLIALAFFGVMLSQASAQQIAICGVGQIDENWIESLELEKKSEINLHIDYINRVCELDKKQLSKLQIAAKMVVGRVIEKAKKQQEGMMVEPMPFIEEGEMEIEEPEAEIDEPEAEVDEVQDDIENDLENQDPPADLPAFAAPARLNVQLIANPVQAGDFTDEEFIYGKSLAYHPVWKKNVDKILTDAQKEAFETAEKERYKQTHQSVIDRSVTRLANILFLNDEQVEKFTELCNKKLEKQIKTEFSGMGQVYDFDGMLYSTTTADEVAEILSEAQLERWKVITRHWQVMPAEAVEVIEAVDE